MDAAKSNLKDRVRELVTARLHLGVSQQEADMLLLMDVQRALLADIEAGMVMTPDDIASTSELLDAILALLASAIEFAAESQNIDPLKFWEVTATRLAGNEAS